MSRRLRFSQAFREKQRGKEYQRGAICAKCRERVFQCKCAEKIKKEKHE